MSALLLSGNRIPQTLRFYLYPRKYRFWLVYVGFVLSLLLYEYEILKKMDISTS